MIDHFLLLNYHDVEKIYQTKFIIKQLFRNDIEYLLPHDKGIKIWINNELLLQSSIVTEREQKLTELAIFVIKRIKKKIPITPIKEGQELNTFQVDEEEAEVPSKESQYDLEAESKVRQFLSICSILVPGNNQSIIIKKDLGGTRYVDEHNIGATFVTKSFRLSWGYEIKPETREKAYEDLTSFVNKSKVLFDLIYKKHQNQPKKFSILFLLLAIEYYYRSSIIESTYQHFAIVKSKIERQFLDLVIALECLFNEGSGDISYKLVMRSTFIYCLLNDQDSSDIFKFFQKIYELRNKIVHGTSSPEINKDDVNLLQKYISSILGSITTLVLSIDFTNLDDENKNKTAKKILLNMIDFAVLDNSRKKNLLTMIKVFEPAIVI